MSLPPVTHYIVIAYDTADANRAAHLDAHLVGTNAAHADGRLDVAGPMFNKEGTKLIGSTALFKADSIDDVRKLIESDPYYLNGVWDKDRITILPFFRGF